MPLVKKIQHSDILVIAITGYGNKLNFPVDQFFIKAKLDDASRIVIIDKSKLQTLGGLLPEFPSFFDLVDHLKKIIMTTPHKQLIITGTSGGAHTALLLGHLLKANEVVAFAPYPYLSISEAKKMKDPALRSMRRVLDKLDLLPNQVKKFLDLKNVLLDWNEVTQYYIHVSHYNKLDYQRATYLGGLPNVNIISHPYREHAVASMLGKDSKLSNCFNFPYVKIYRHGDLILHLKNIIIIPARAFKSAMIFAVTKMRAIM